MANTLRFKRGLVSGIPTAALGEPLFTTDTFDLYIGNGTGNTRFQKYIASGTTSQLLRGDGSLLTMPIVLTSPSNGQVLKYDGTNWVNSSDAGVTGSGTAGQVTYWGSSSTITGSNNLFWDATNNRLGIGTNNPVNRFQVDGVTVGLLSVQSISDRVGIGTTSPNSRLEVYSATGYNVIRSVGGSGGYFETYSTGGTRHSSFGSESNGDVYLGARANNPLIFLSNNAERARIFAGGNVAIGSTSDNGLRLQVTGDGYFSGSVGIGASTGLTDINLRITKALAGSVFPTSISVAGTIAQAATTGAVYVQTSAITEAAAFTLPNLYHFRSTQGTFGAGSTVTNQYGYIAESSLIGATNNFGFYGNIASGTGRWNLYMNGTADNFTAGDFYVGIPTLRTSDASIRKFILNGSQSGIGAEIVLTNETANDAASNAISFVGIRGAYGISGQIRTTRRGIMTFHTQDLQSLVSPPERMRLDASGNLGLGVTPSAGSLWRQFEIGAAGASLTGRPSNTEIFLTQNAYHNNSSWIYKVNGTAAYFGIDGGDFRWYNAPSGTAAGAITFTERMRLFNATGNLTIGSTPTDAGFKLDVNGTMRVSGNLINSSGFISAVSEYRINGNSFQRIATTNAGGGFAGGYNLTLNAGVVQHDSNGAISGHYYHNSGYVAFFSGSTQVAGTNAVERLRLNTDGSANFTSSVIVGGTSVNASAVLQADSTTKGFLPPRMTTTQKNAITTPPAGLIVYDTTLNKLCVYTTAWETITSL